MQLLSVCPSVRTLLCSYYMSVRLLGLSWAANSSYVSICENVFVIAHIVHLSVCPSVRTLLCSYYLSVRLLGLSWAANSSYVSICENVFVMAHIVHLSVCPSVRTLLCSYYLSDQLLLLLTPSSLVDRICYYRFLQDHYD